MSQTRLFSLSVCCVQAGVGSSGAPGLSVLCREGWPSCFLRVVLLWAEFTLSRLCVMTVHPPGVSVPWCVLLSSYFLSFLSRHVRWSLVSSISQGWLLNGDLHFQWEPSVHLFSLWCWCMGFAPVILSLIFICPICFMSTLFLLIFF